jgi:enoyl-[acyl-carrier protein] reductase I
VVPARATAPENTVIDRAPSPGDAAPPRGGLLAGRRGVVLGVSGSNSIGFHVARALHDHGATVAVTCRPARLSNIAELAGELAAAAYPVEIADEPSLAAAFAALGHGDAPLDFVVHGLVDIPEGVLARSLLELSRADFEHVMSVTTWSLIAAARYAHPLLLRSTAPRIVALTSACSHRMTPHYHAAGIAKAALESAVLYLAMQLGRDGVLVNAVGSSMIATDGAIRAIGAHNAQATRAVQARRSATGHAIEPGDVAGTVSFLCSPLARNLTGEIITVDGGFSRSYL